MSVSQQRLYAMEVLEVKTEPPSESKVDDVDLAENFLTKEEVEGDEDSEEEPLTKEENKEGCSIEGTATRAKVSLKYRFTFTFFFSVPGEPWKGEVSPPPSKETRATPSPRWPSSDAFETDAAFSSWAARGCRFRCVECSKDLYGEAEARYRNF